MSRVQPKKLKIAHTMQAAGGTVIAGTIYDWNEKTQRYEYKLGDQVVSTVNPAMVETMPSLFQKIYE